MDPLRVLSDCAGVTILSPRGDEWIRTSFADILYSYEVAFQIGRGWHGSVEMYDGGTVLKPVWWKDFPGSVDLRVELRGISSFSRRWR